MSDAYRRVVFTTLAAIMNDAVRRKLIPASPCREVKRPKPPHSRAGSWTPQQVAAVRAALPGRWQVLVDLGARLGLRQGEIFGLAVGDVDFLRQVVHVRRQVRIVGSKLVFAAPKGNKIRDVPLPKVVADALAAHLAAYPARPVTLPWNEPGGEPETAQLVLTSAAGGAPNRNTINTYVWKPALRAAGMPASRENGMHVLRHTFASDLLHHGCGSRRSATTSGTPRRRSRWASTRTCCPPPTTGCGTRSTRSRPKIMSPRCPRPVRDGRLRRQNAHLYHFTKI